MLFKQFMGSLYLRLLLKMIDLLKCKLLAMVYGIFYPPPPLEIEILITICHESQVLDEDAFSEQPPSQRRYGVSLKLIAITVV